MPPSVAANVKFCQSPEQTTAIRMPIGSWLDKTFGQRIDWDNATDHEHDLYNAMEDFITARLCELHRLPFIRTAFTNDQLAQLATPQQQADIWADMLARFPT